VGDMVRMRGAIELVVPRGGAGLIEYVREHAQVPVVTGGIGVCHTYVHEDADLQKALDIVHNAKTRRPTICNALDTVLVQEAHAPQLLPARAWRWAQAGAQRSARGHASGCRPAGESFRLDRLRQKQDLAEENKRYHAACSHDTGLADGPPCGTRSVHRGGVGHNRGARRPRSPRVRSRVRRAPA